MSDMRVSGQLNSAESHCLFMEVGTSEYACVLFNIFAKSMKKRTSSQGKHQGAWFRGDTKIPQTSYLGNRKRMVRITSSPQGWQRCMDPWLRRQYEVGDFDQMELPGWWKGFRIDRSVGLWKTSVPLTPSVTSHAFARVAHLLVDQLLFSSQSHR